MANTETEPTKKPSFAWRALIATLLVALGGLLSQIGRTMLEDEPAPVVATPIEQPSPPLGEAPATETE